MPVARPDLQLERGQLTLPGGLRAAFLCPARGVQGRDERADPARLSMADGTVTPVPVTWEDVPSSATSTPGQLVVNGTTASGPVTAVVDVVRRPLVPVVGR